MKDFIIRIIILIVAIVVLRFVGRLLVRFVYEPLDRFCNKHGYSTNPFLLGIWTTLLLVEYNFRYGYDALLQAQKLPEWITPSVYAWIVLALLSIPYAALLIKTRVIHFVPVMLTKILILPMAAIAMLCGYERSTGAGEDYYTPPGSGGHYPTPSTDFPPPTYPVPGNDSGGHYSGGSDYEPSYSGGDGGRQPWDLPDGGYSPEPVKSKPVTYEGDYRPFDSGTDVSTYDADYAPMD